MKEQGISEDLDRPGARDLLESATLLRLGYNGSDGYPRAVPTGFYWDGTQIVTPSDESSRGAGLGSALLRQGLERAGGLRLDIRTRTEGYYERLGASRSLGFRLTRQDLGLEGGEIE